MSVTRFVTVINGGNCGARDKAGLGDWGPKDGGFLASFLLSTAGLPVFSRGSFQLQAPNCSSNFYSNSNSGSVFLSCLTIICAISILLSLSLVETRRL